jgi:hypothetical protein
MKTSPPVLPLLVFEAADCLMALPASEVAQLDASTDTYKKSDQTPFFDLGEYFVGRESEGPWLHWARGTRSAWLRVRRVIDVVPVALTLLTPMPALITAQQRSSRAFLAAGLRGDEVFLLLDPARLRHQ